MLNLYQIWSTPFYIVSLTHNITFRFWFSNYWSWTSNHDGWWWIVSSMLYHPINIVRISVEFGITVEPWDDRQIWVLMLLLLIMIQQQIHMTISILTLNNNIDHDHNYRRTTCTIDTSLFRKENVLHHISNCCMNNVLIQSNTNLSQAYISHGSYQ